ncbi:hypothetical protein QQP08_004091 [Theobroma cacao]|nr:hypothetical protein QQP08_004091 [Theobroma cacao]
MFITCNAFAFRTVWSSGKPRVSFSGSRFVRVGTLQTSPICRIQLLEMTFDINASSVIIVSFHVTITTPPITASVAVAQIKDAKQLKTEFGNT